MRKFLFVFFLLIPTIVFAETITLKSGKVVEGEIIEKTDEYVRIDSQGQISKIKFRLMDEEASRRLKSMPFLIKQEEGDGLSSEPSDDLNDDFVIWKDAVEPYFMRLSEANAKFAENSMKYMNSNPSLEAADGIHAAYDEHLKELKEIDAPEDLRGFHQKIIKMMEVIKSSLTGDSWSAEDFTQLSNEIDRELSDAFKKHGGGDSAFQFELPGMPAFGENSSSQGQVESEEPSAFELEVEAAQKLTSLRSSVEKYYLIHDEQYPQNVDELEAYDSDTFCGRIIGGYSYECDFSIKEYTILAVPTGRSASGKGMRTFKATKDGFKCIEFGDAVN